MGKMRRLAGRQRRSDPKRGRGGVAADAIHGGVADEFGWECRREDEVAWGSGVRRGQEADPRHRSS
jgi:hypothetical protein